MTYQNAARRGIDVAQADSTARTLREAMGPGYGAALSSDRVVQNHPMPYRPWTPRRQLWMGLAGMLAAVGTVLRRRRSPVAISMVAATTCR